MATNRGEARIFSQEGEPFLTPSVHLISSPLLSPLLPSRSPSIPSLSFPSLSSNPARGLVKRCKLLQQVRVEPGRQTILLNLEHKIKH